MKNYNEWPPVKYLIRVLKNCPNSALLYIQLWKNQNKHYKISVRKKEIRKLYLISPTMFRNSISPLAFLSLVSFAEDEEQFQIEIFGHVDE